MRVRSNAVVRIFSAVMCEVTTVRSQLFGSESPNCRLSFESTQCACSGRVAPGRHACSSNSQKIAGLDATALRRRHFVVAAGVGRKLPGETAGAALDFLSFEVLTETTTK